MQQHPIPQQISSYEFRLVGNMTLKQFFKLAGGLVIAFIIYSSKMIFILKWPLALSSGFLGFALAFLPINERPLETWIFAFIKSVFSPTIFLWQKQPIILDALDTSLKEEDDDDDDDEYEDELRETKGPRLEEFIATLPRITKEEKEKEKKPTPPPQKEPVQKEAPQERVIKEKPARKAGDFSLPDNIPTAKPEIKIKTLYTPPQATAEPEFGEIPMPEPPTTPNIVVGMTISQEGKIVDDAIIEIQDTAGNPVRALRTNRLGQFKTTAPLPNDEYLVLPEKEGYQFDIIKIKAKGKIIPPLKIRAKA